MVEGPHLLYTLNRYLAHTALLVQPLGPGGPAGGAPPLGGSASHPALSDTPALATLDIPLPLPQPGEVGCTCSCGVRERLWLLEHCGRPPALTAPS